MSFLVPSHLSKCLRIDEWFLKALGIVFIVYKSSKSPAAICFVFRDLATVPSPLFLKAQ